MIACDIINYKPELLNLSLKRDDTKATKFISILQCICNTICYLGFGSGLAFLAVSGFLLIAGAEAADKMVFIANLVAATILTISGLLFLIGRYLDKKRGLLRELNNADIYYHQAIHDKDILNIGLVLCSRKYCAVSVDSRGDGCVVAETVKFKSQKLKDIKKPIVNVENRIVLLPK